jgi:nitrous oxide reductase accessory protein NosL
MKIFCILLLVSFLAACATKPAQKNEAIETETSQKITITGTRIKRSEIPPGPKLKMSLNKKNEASNFMEVVKVMQTLPQPKDIGDCKGLLSALSKNDLKLTIVDSNKVILESEHGIYEYSFDDGSCPINET